MLHTIYRLQVYLFFMAELLVKHLSTPVALVYFDQLLDVSQRVGLAISVSAAVGTALASKLADTRKGQEAVCPAEALDNIGMQVRLHSVVNIAPELLL